MENSTKQVDSCIKMFALIKLLLEDDANFSQVVGVISEYEHPVSTDNSIHSVTLSKYINTLKLIGINVKKEKGKYHLINPPYKFELNQDELNAFMLIKECASKLNEEGKTKEEFDKFIKACELRFSEQTQILSKKHTSQNKADFGFYFDKLTNKVDICSKFCNEDYKVEIVYYPKGKKTEKKIIAKAQELLYRRNSIQLQVLDITSTQTTTISLDKIISIKQMPVKIPRAYSTNRVTVYGLRGRLAKNYRVRNWEIAEGYRGEWLIIKNKDESEEELIQRLLKYGASCKIFSPAVLKDKIVSAFENTLKLYE